MRCVKIIMAALSCSLILDTAAVKAMPVEAEKYEYDRLGRVTKVTYEDGSSITYEYDANGNILKVRGDIKQSTETGYVESEEENTQENTQENGGHTTKLNGSGKTDKKTDNLKKANKNKLGVLVKSIERFLKKCSDLIHNSIEKIFKYTI